MKEWRVYSKPEPGKEKGGVIIWWPEWDERDAREWFRENVEGAGPNHFYFGATLELVEFETREERIRAALEQSTVLLEDVDRSFTDNWAMDWSRVTAQAEANRKALSR